MPSITVILAVSFALATSTLAQLTGRVGPLTSRLSKAENKTCNVLSYGGVADGQTDIAPAITAAFNACKTGGLVLIPAGNYSLGSYVALSGGNAWALQLDGLITRSLNQTAGGNMIWIEHAQDFEMFSSTSKGAVQGNGYQMHRMGSVANFPGPRILRLSEVVDFSVHDLALTDAPQFHMTVDTCSNGEVYNMAVRGANFGGVDGFDVWGTNIWVHDVTVTNKDECVTVKSPASNILVEDIYCNWSGGSAIGSLGANTNISNILYRRVYTWQANQMMLVKSNGGNGSLTNVLFENFIGHGNAYSLNIDQYWSGQTPVVGPGVELSNITFKNWHGTEANGTLRGPVRVVCADTMPCHDIHINNLAMWSEVSNSQWYDCRSSYGTGFCLRSPNVTVAYVTTTITTVHPKNGKTVYKTKTSASMVSNYKSYPASTTYVTVPPPGYSAPSMASDLQTAFGTNMSIPVPTIPTSFFPGRTPISQLLGNAKVTAA